MATLNISADTEYDSEEIAGMQTTTFRPQCH